MEVFQDVQLTTSLSNRPQDVHHAPPPPHLPLRPPLLPPRPPHVRHCHLPRGAALLGPLLLRHDRRQEHDRGRGFLHSGSDRPQQDRRPPQVRSVGAAAAD